jgi:hypothetical protein
VNKPEICCFLLLTAEPPRNFRSFLRDSAVKKSFFLFGRIQKKLFRAIAVGGYSPAMDININTPALLFPAIILIMLA